MSKEWFAGKLAQASNASSSWSKRIDKESEPGTFGATKFSAACVIGSCVTAGTMVAVNHFLGPGVDRGAVMNAMWTGLCCVELFAFSSTLAGFASPWTSKALSSAATLVSDTASGLAESLKGTNVPAIDFSKITQKSSKIKDAPDLSTKLAKP